MSTLKPSDNVSLATIHKSILVRILKDIYTDPTLGPLLLKSTDDNLVHVTKQNHTWELR
jgi:hypothetical protein